MKNKWSVFISISVLVFFGAGCANDSPTDLDRPLPSGAMNQVQDGLVEPPPSPPKENNQEQNMSQANPNDLVQEEAQKTEEATTTAAKEEEGPLAFPGVLPSADITNKQVRIKTSKGDIVFELLPKEGPKAASNFVYLAKRKFYDGLMFHRVVPHFVIQGGDSLTRYAQDPYHPYGSGDPGYKFEDDKVSQWYTTGTVAMANSGPNTNGSQFFIMLETPDWEMPKSYSIFGRVTKGMDVVGKIGVGDKMISVTVEPKK